MENYERLISFRDLESDWSGYGALPINPLCILNAMELLLEIEKIQKTTPFVYPCPDGNIQIEIEYSDQDIDIEIFEDRGHCEYLVYDKKSENTDSGTTIEYFQVIEVLQKLQEASVQKSEEVEEFLEKRRAVMYNQGEGDAVQGKAPQSTEIAYLTGYETAKEDIR